MDTKPHADHLVGRGNRDGAQLFRDWFAELSDTAGRDGQAAYVFVMGSLNEILKVFDLPDVRVGDLGDRVDRLAIRPGGRILEDLIHVANEFIPVFESERFILVPVFSCH